MLVVLGSLISNSVGFYDKIIYFMVALKLELRLNFVEIEVQIN